jgi:hypothetical protein
LKMDLQLQHHEMAKEMQQSIPTQILSRLSRRGRTGSCPAVSEFQCGQESQHGLVSLRGLSPGTGCCPNAMASRPRSFPRSFPAVPRGHHAAVIIPGDLMVRKLQAHGCTTSGSRLGSDEGVQVHASLDDLSGYSSS